MHGELTTEEELTTAELDTKIMLEEDETASDEELELNEELEDRLDEDDIGLLLTAPPTFIINARFTTSPFPQSTLKTSLNNFLEKLFMLLSGFGVFVVSPKVVTVQLFVI